MQIRVLQAKSVESTIDATFPSYTRWIGEDTERRTRLDEDGSCVSIRKSYNDYEPPMGTGAVAYEIECQQLRMDRPIYSSYFSDGNPNTECSEQEFLELLDEAAGVMTKVRWTITP